VFECSEQDTAHCALRTEAVIAASAKKCPSSLNISIQFYHSQYSASPLYFSSPMRLFPIFTIALAAAQAQNKAPLSCPETMKDHAFERVSIYNGTPSDEYELAPDDEKTIAGKIVQVWKLKDYRTMNIFLRCRYHDTTATRVMDVPAVYNTCTFTFMLDKKGKFLGKSDLLCR
jgi:hypothetical protein